MQHVVMLHRLPLVALQAWGEVVPDVGVGRFGTFVSCRCDDVVRSFRKTSLCFPRWELWAGPPF